MDDTVTTQYKISVSVLCSAYCPLATLLLSSLYLQRFSILCCVLSRVVCVARVLSICMCFLRLQCRWALSATVSNRTYLQQFSWQHIWFVYATISPRASWSMIHIFMMTFSLGLVKIIIWFKCKKKKKTGTFLFVIIFPCIQILYTVLVQILYPGSSLDHPTWKPSYDLCVV